MKRPAIPRLERRSAPGLRDRRGERGVTLVLIATAMVAIMAMAALSIDIVTLYLADAEAQRSADAAALAAARVLSLSSVTGDPRNTSLDWAAACNLATQVAQGVANRNNIGGTAPNSVNVTFPNDPSGNCSDGMGTSTVFGLNPIVQVQVQRANLPTFFARIWGHRGASVSATAAAEAYNPSNSATYAGSMVPVQARCVKPWIVANKEPGATSFVSTADGSITNSGISGGKVIGKTFTLSPACGPLLPNCANVTTPDIPASSYIPASVQGASVAVASCATSDIYQEAIGGCDQSTTYACGTPNGAAADLTINPGKLGGDTSVATQCLISQSGGQDQLTAPFPFQIQAGSGNPLVLNKLVINNDVITASNSIATVPIMDNTAPFGAGNTVTIVGFLQVFINVVDGNGNPNVTILNVSGCSNNAGATGVSGTSPVPVRLINYP